MKNLPMDKVAHFSVSAWLVLAIYLFTNDLDWAFFGAFGMGVLWEFGWKIFDKRPFDLYDIGANFVGCWFSLFVIGIKIWLS